MSDRHICKAKRTDNGEWVEGYFFEFEGKLYITCLEETIVHAIYTEEPSVKDFDMRAFDVDPPTVCQCTGLPDKNGKNIFKWDIVKEEKEIGVVKFGKYGNGFHYGFYIEWVTLPDLRQELAYWKGRVERIGTFFDNSELLEGGAE